MNDEPLAAWDRVEDWLKANAPCSYASLRPPAGPERVAAAQARMGVTWPREVAALWLRHDGAEGFEVDGDEEGEVDPAKFLAGYTFLPLDEAVRVHAARSDPDTGAVGCTGWVPLSGADDDYAGEMVVVDGPDAGRMGRWSATDRARLHGAYTTLGGYLTAVAEALETGTGPLADRDGVVPGVSLGCLVWQNPRAVSAVDAPWEPVHPDR
ncbi:SMI1/KNR4 family protein [Streptomyces similanensis]|uniref:Knr4/Smi1-like domain-containing protein n=1 Tax=Streptomyces similanensis TaxID=1274988 RepID=A0ABP9LFW7_9ACTN